MSSATASSQRPLVLSGSFNVRDIGGLPAANGLTTSCGEVYRSASLANLTPEDIRELNRRGIRWVCDLRSTPERLSQPAPPALACVAEIWSRDHEASAADIVSILRREGAKSHEARALMLQTYRNLALEQKKSFAAFLSRLASDGSPVLIHCAAGKDRTGAAIALLLDLLGVERPAIVNDYLLSNDVTSRLWANLEVRLTSAGESLVDRGLWGPVLKADADYLDAFFETLDSEFGGSQRYVEQELNLDARIIEYLSRRLLSRSYCPKPADGAVKTD